MALTFIVKYESKEDSKIENLETTNFSQEESDDEENLQEAYDKIFEESLKLKKQNWSIFKKLHVFQLEKEGLLANLEESTCSVNELNVENKSLENKVKTLVNKLDKSNAQLRTFSSGSKKLDNLLRLNKTTGNGEGLDYNENGSHVTTSSKTNFVLAYTKSKKVEVSEPKSKDRPLGRKSLVHQRIPQPKVLNFKPNTVP